MLVTILSVIFAGFMIGALARWAVPGPDPMPAWLTIAIGLGGSALGGAVVAALVGTDEGRDYFAVMLTSIAAAGVLVIAYRRFVQRRPVTGPDARKLPSRGFGVARLRRRLQHLGFDPETLEPIRPDRRQESLRKLRELRDEGLLTQEEYETKRAQLEQG